MTDLSRAEARRIAVAAQGFADARPAGRIDIRHLRRVLSRVGLLQIDTVNVLVRSHYMPLFSRLGPYPMSLLDDAVYRRRELFETWAHEASFVPVEHYPLWRHRMEGEAGYLWTRRWAGANKGYIEQVLNEVRRRGPLAHNELTEPGERWGTFWTTSRGKGALEWLLRRGRVMVHDRHNFQRIYDLTERIIPQRLLDGSRPSEIDAQRALLLLAARSHGVGAARDLADYYRLPIPASRKLLRELADEGALRAVSVEGWKETAYLHPDARTLRSVRAQALLTPFDSLIWERDRTERLFDFRYRIEIYVPQKQREFGYYVLPFLLDDRLVARVDLKADRSGGRLLVKAAYLEAGQAAGAVVERLAAELRLMAGWLALDTVRVGRRGNLARQLRDALRL